MINNSRNVSNSTLRMCYGNSLQIQLVWCGLDFFFSSQSSWAFTHSSRKSRYPKSKPLPCSETGISPAYSALCDSEHVAEINETVKSKFVGGLWVFLFFVFLIHRASQCFTCRLIKRLTVMFIKTWMVTLFEMTNSSLYIMRSVKHPEKKCIIW